MKKAPDISAVLSKAISERLSAAFQAKLIKDFWEDGGKMVEGGHKAMELLEAYIRALEARH